jgi:hypothetical protein
VGSVAIALIPADATDLLAGLDEVSNGVTVEAGDPREGPCRGETDLTTVLAAGDTCDLCLEIVFAEAGVCAGGACVSALVDAVDDADQRALVDGGWGMMGSNDVVDLGSH